MQMQMWFAHGSGKFRGRCSLPSTATARGSSAGAKLWRWCFFLRPRRQEPVTGLGQQNRNNPSDHRKGPGPGCMGHGRT